MRFYRTYFLIIVSLFLTSIINSCTTNNYLSSPNHVEVKNSELVNNQKPKSDIGYLNNKKLKPDLSPNIEHNSLSPDMLKVIGEACFEYGDKDTPFNAKQEAIAQAKRNAIENYKGFISSDIELRNTKIYRDQVKWIAAGYLYKISIINETEQGREICVSIQAYVKPDEIDKLIAGFVDRFKQQKPDNSTLQSPSKFPDVSNPPDLTPLTFPDIPKSADLTNMVKIDGGSFLYGEKQKEINLPTFYIDKYEITNNQFVDFLNKYGNRKEKGAYWLDFTDPDSLIKKRKNEFYSKSKMGNKPVVEVTWYGAKAFCECNGKRLPSEQEWEKAARSTDGWEFVWGNNLPSDFKDTNFITNELNNVFNNGDALVDVDNFGKDKSEYEIYNMAGNVSEWTSSWYDEEKTDRVSRGGSWDSKRIDDIYTTYRDGDKPALSSYAIGFRCAKSQ